MAMWWIAGGERVGLGNGASAIFSQGGVVTFTAADSIFRADDVGKTLRLTDCTTGANNGNKVISRYISAKHRSRYIPGRIGKQDLRQRVERRRVRLDERRKLGRSSDREHLDVGRRKHADRRDAIDGRQRLRGSVPD